MKNRERASLKKKKKKKKKNPVDERGVGWDVIRSIIYDTRICYSLLLVLISDPISIIIINSSARIFLLSSSAAGEKNSFKGRQNESFCSSGLGPQPPAFDLQFWRQKSRHEISLKSRDEVMKMAVANW